MRDEGISRTPQKREASEGLGWGGGEIRQSIEYPGYFSGQRSSSSMPSSPSPQIRGERGSMSPVPQRYLGTPEQKGRKGVLRKREEGGGEGREEQTEEEGEEALSSIVQHQRH
ncbi:hypothetical protein KCU76_g71, partial [Aureobasidium melanogenum]